MKTEFQIDEIVAIDSRSSRHFKYGVIECITDVNNKFMEITTHAYISMFTTLEEAINQGGSTNKTFMSCDRLTSTGYFNNYRVLQRI